MKELHLTDQIDATAGKPAKLLLRWWAEQKRKWGRSRRRTILIIYNPAVATENAMYRLTCVIREETGAKVWALKAMINKVDFYFVDFDQLEVFTPRQAESIAVELRKLSLCGQVSITE